MNALVVGLPLDILAQIAGYQNDRQIGVERRFVLANPADQFQTVGRLHLQIGDQKIWLVGGDAFEGGLGVIEHLVAVDPERLQDGLQDHAGRAMIVHHHHVEVFQVRGSHGGRFLSLFFCASSQDGNTARMAQRPQTARNL